jgi:hypothetical protein
VHMLRERGVVLDPLAAFSTSLAPPWHGVLMAYGHMDSRQLGLALDILEASLTETGS